MPPRELNSKIYQHIFWSQMGFGAIVIVVVWALVLATLVLEMLGLQLVRNRLMGADSVLSSGMALGFAAVVTPLGLLWYIPRFWRAVHLARVGQPVAGTIRRKLGVTLHGFDTIQVSYSVERQAYTAKMGVDGVGIAIGESTIVLVDPDRPQCAMLQSQVLPAEDTEPA